MISHFFNNFFILQTSFINNFICVGFNISKTGIVFMLKPRSFRTIESDETYVLNIFKEKILFLYKR